MHVVLVGADMALVETVQGWLADDGHLARHTDSAETLTAWHEQRSLHAVIGFGHLHDPLAAACTALVDSGTAPPKLIAIGSDAGPLWHALELPLRRRVLRAAINSA